MRAPSIDEIVATFSERWEQTRDPETNRGDLELALQSVRDLILHGAARSRARAGIVDRKRRRRPTRQRRALSDDEATVLRRVARAGRIPVDRLTAQDRSRVASQWRFVAMWIFRRGLGRSQAEIATILGRRDHSCVHRGVGIVERRIARDPGLAAQLRRLAA